MTDCLAKRASPTKGLGQIKLGFAVVGRACQGVPP